MYLCADRNIFISIIGNLTHEKLKPSESNNPVLFGGGFTE